MFSYDQHLFVVSYNVPLQTVDHNLKNTLNSANQNAYIKWHELHKRDLEVGIISFGQITYV